MIDNIDYLTIDDLIKIGEAVIPNFLVRDLGALESAVARPQTTIYGQDAYPEFETKVAALLHSIVRNHGLVDGNKRLAWSCARTFCLINGYDINLSVDAAEKVVVGAASGDLNVVEIALGLNIRST